MARAILKKDFKDGDKLYGQQLNNNFGTIEAALDAMNKIAWQDDPDESVTAFRGTTEQIQSQPIIDGQLLYDISTGETYTDYNGERVSTGSGNAIHIGADTPENEATQIWIDPTEPVTNIGTEVVNNLDGDETHMSPSVHAIKDANTYSTEEVKTGETWIDGKPIYRKVIQINSLPNNAETTYQTGIVNGETIKHQGFLSLTSGDVALQPMPYISPNQESGNIYYWIRKDATLIDVRTKTDRTSASAYFIIEYTKTTDGSDS